jgi:hypothetical protein
MSEPRMKVLPRVIQPLQRAVAAFFGHDLALRREDNGLRVVLQRRDGTSPPRPPSRADAALQKEAHALALMLAQLDTLLGDLPDTRQTLRHLVFVEQALQKKGLRALHKLPLEVLQRGLEQFESLVSNWSPEGLANLRSKMAVAIIDREHMDPNAEADAYKTSAIMDVDAARSDSGFRVVEAGAGAGVSSASDDDALAAAYAALGAASPTTPPPQAGVQTQGELGSPSVRALPRSFGTGAPLPEIKLRELHAAHSSERAADPA